MSNEMAEIYAELKELRARVDEIYEKPFVL
jgi:hypothetical protein